MDSRLKQRLIGAAVLVALAVIFLPMLVQGPAPDSGVSDVPLSMPDTPHATYETRDLPLVTPGNAPDGGAVGMDSSHPAAPPGASSPVVDTVKSVASSSQTAPTSDSASAASVPLPQPTKTAGEMLPAPTAAGDYAVNLGTYATTTAADAVIGSLRASQLPGYREATTSNDKPAWRVRIGPYATRAAAEAARLRATQVRSDVGARVVALDAQVVPTTTATPRAATPAPAPATAIAKPEKKPASAAVKPAEPIAAIPKPVEPAKPVAASAAADTGFAIQLAAFSKLDDAAALRDKLRAAGFTAFTESVVTDKGTLTRVRVGPVVSRADADQLKAQVKAKLGLDGIVRPHP
jgi:cell division septation protein DedD